MAIKASALITLSSVTDVASVTRYYLLQSSTLASPEKPAAVPPDGSWTDTEPTYTTGSTNSLFFTDLTVFSDGTWSYSSVSLSSAYEAAKVAYNKANSAQNVANLAQSTADTVKSDLKRIVRIDDAGLHVGDNQSTNNEVLIDSEGVNVVTGGLMESKFTGSYIQFGYYQLRRTADNGLAFKVKEV
ncbi:MAG: hypothetical protein QM271_05710 [Bacillota bacterium]|nr:hypothetical protein [Bacillota bacterium]